MLVWFFAILCILALCPVPLILESSMAYFFEATQPLSTRSDTTWLQAAISRGWVLLVGHGSFCCTFGLWKMIYLLCTERFNNSKGFTCKLAICVVIDYIVHYIHSMFSNWQCSCLSAIGNLVIYIVMCHQTWDLERCSVSSFFVLWVPKDCNNLRNEFTSFTFQYLWMRRVVHQAKARCQMSGVKSFTWPNPTSIGSRTPSKLRQLRQLRVLCMSFHCHSLSSGWLGLARASSSLAIGLYRTCRREVLCADKQPPFPWFWQSLACGIFMQYWNHLQSVFISSVEQLKHGIFTPTSPTRPWMANDETRWSWRYSNSRPWMKMAGYIKYHQITQPALSSIITVYHILICVSCGVLAFSLAPSFTFGILTGYWHVRTWFDYMIIS